MFSTAEDMQLAGWAELEARRFEGRPKIGRRVFYNAVGGNHGPDIALFIARDRLPATRAVIPLRSAIRNTSFPAAKRSGNSDPY